MRKRQAASLLWALDSRQKGDLSLLYWILRESLRLGHLGARELLRLENVCKGTGRNAPTIAPG